MNLTNAQIKYIKKKSHAIKSLFQMGKAGLSDNFIEQIDQALEKRELIKFNLLQNSDEEITEMAEEIASEVDAFVIQVMGSTATLYRPSTDRKNQDLSQEVKHI